jgi:hypothetical protein
VREASAALPGNADGSQLYDSWMSVIVGGVLVNGTLEELYPHIAPWVQAHGWIEIGYDDYSRSFVRALDIGGMIWEGQEHYPTVDEALQALERALAEWMRA